MIWSSAAPPALAASPPGAAPPLLLLAAEEDEGGTSLLLPVPAAEPLLLPLALRSLGLKAPAPAPPAPGVREEEEEAGCCCLLDDAPGAVASLLLPLIVELSGLSGAATRAAGLGTVDVDGVLAEEAGALPVFVAALELVSVATPAGAAVRAGAGAGADDDVPCCCCFAPAAADAAGVRGCCSLVSTSVAPDGLKGG